MKNTIKCLGIIALVVVIGFAMTACDDGNGGGGGATAPQEIRGKWVQTTESWGNTIVYEIEIFADYFLDGFLSGTKTRNNITSVKPSSRAGYDTEIGVTGASLHYKLTDPNTANFRFSGYGNSEDAPFIRN